jgi:GNAT superfamily N-acetyltransferase
MTMPTPVEIKKSFSAARILGNGDDRVTLSENELFCLLTQCCRDLAIPSSVSTLPSVSLPPPDSDYYKLPLAWFQIPQANCPSAPVLVECLAACVAHEADFRLYFENLATLHKRRLKYQRILSGQPKPTMNQVGPRSLLEFGGVHHGLLGSWLIWRKWIFDVDNRAAQETGYLFEPVLASCLGGEAVGSRNSPVKRLNERNEPTEEGRQIDCYDGESQLAYEFKLRVTIAASGQGRFAEELSFPREARAAGLTPVLIVLDPTPSPRLDELIAMFNANRRGAVGSAVAVHVASRRWLNFLDGMDALVTSMIEIRKCRAEDFDAILPLLRQLYPDKAFNLPSLQRAYDHSLASDQLVFLCAVCEQRVIGFGSLTIKSNLLWYETLIGYVSDMVVDRAYRSRGIGSQILDHLVSWAREHGCRRIELNTAFHRKDSRTFYERRGFKSGAYFYSKSL